MMEILNKEIMGIPMVIPIALIGIIVAMKLIKG